MNLRVEYHCLFASSSSRYFVPARDVKPVLELRLELRFGHILPFLLDSVRVIVRIVSFGLTLSGWYSFDDDAFPDGRDEVWVTSLAILA